LDASALARVRKLIRQDTILSPDDLFPASGNSAAFGLPPAARSILDSILRSRPGEAHIAPLKKRGAMPLVRLLLDRQLILMLSGGQLIATVSLAELASQLPNGTELAVPDIAGLWQTSVGTARGLVSALMDEGFLDRTAPGIYKVVTPGSRTNG
jgi:hypothetical protein